MHGQPRELELRVQKDVTPGPRTRRVARTILSYSHPITTQICRESRMEALQIYQRRFRTKISDSYIYTCWDQDLVSLKDNDLAHIELADLAEIRQIRLHIHDVAYFTHYHTEYILRMDKLQLLELVLDEDVAGVAGTDQHARWWPRLILSDFDMARYSDPGRVWPKIVIKGKTAGNTLLSFEGGALLPGWKRGDPHPDQLANNVDV